MLLTEHFVMLNLPKTGSSFVREVIKELYAQSGIGYQTTLELSALPDTMRYCIELLLPNIRVRRPGPPEQHGTFAQIPRCFSGHDVWSVLRNPYEKFISGYSFGWWRDHPPLDAQSLRELFPTFPDLSLDQYVDLCREDVRVNRGLVHSIDIGLQTVQFLQMFAVTPSSVFGILDESVLDGAILEDLIGPVKFLRQSNLRTDLSEMLVSYGFDPGDLSFIQTHDAVNATPGRLSAGGTSLTPKAREYIERSERLLLRFFNRIEGGERRTNEE